MLTYVQVCYDNYMPVSINFVGCASDNYMVGRDGHPIKQITIHWMDGTLAGTDSWFHNPSSKVSAHYGIADKIVHQYVKDTDTSYGAGNWGVNLETINIEHEGSPTHPITEETYQTSAHLIAELCQKYAIPCDRDHIRKHSEVSLHPTACPGTLDIDKLVQLAYNILNLPIPAPEPVQTSSIPQQPTDGLMTLKVTVSALRVRKEPNTSSVCTGELQSNQLVIANGITAGEMVAGNATWYKLTSGLFVWGGGVEVVNPSNRTLPLLSITIQVNRSITANQSAAYNQAVSDFKAKVSQILV